MSKKVSFADRIYDRFCDDYVLKAAGKGGATVQKKGFNEYRASSYLIEGLGRLTLLRANGLFGPKQEEALFIPFEKDAPLLRIVSTNKAGTSILSVQLPEVMLSPVRYQQFSRVLEGFGKLQEQEPDGAFQGISLLPGSATKSGSPEELSSMLDEYLSAYLRVLTMAPGCDRREKQEKIAEAADTYLKNEGNNGILRQLAVGDNTEAFIKKIVFGI